MTHELMNVIILSLIISLSLITVVKYHKLKLRTNEFESRMKTCERKLMQDSRAFNDITMIHKNLVDIRNSIKDIIMDMRKMQGDITEGQQNDINIDAKYKLKLQQVNALLDKTMSRIDFGNQKWDKSNTQVIDGIVYSKDDLNASFVNRSKAEVNKLLKDNSIAFDPMENRTKAEKDAFSKLASQIAGTEI
jgi:hypothetical protein